MTLSVAVIGAGVAGLIAARELKQNGHRVTIYEKSGQLGGTWAYDSRVELDPLSLDPTRVIVHNSLYSSLRTNHPRQIMRFTDYPFTRVYSDPSNFPGHEEVLLYLKDFARHFQLVELIRFNTEVVRVERRVDSVSDEWVVESRSGEFGREEVFEAVVVCNGHHTEPQVAHFAGFDKWPGKQMHSHNYRVPEPFQDQVVVIIGAGPSAYDISKDIALVAKEVHLSIRSPVTGFFKLIQRDNVMQHSKIAYVDETGIVTFDDGSSVYADIIFHCTGYRYNFPFLNTNGIVTVDDNRVGPLYKHVFSPELGPRLSFVGLPYGNILFPMMELQSKWISLVLSNKVPLPSKAAMLANIKEHYRFMEEQRIPKKHTHSLFKDKFAYMDCLAEEVGVAPVEGQMKRIYEQLLEVFFNSEGDEFREWNVDGWINSTI